MNAEQHLLQTPQVEIAVEELSALIKEHYPDAVFEIGRGEDPGTVYVRAIVDTDDLDAVADRFIERLVELQVEDELSVYVVPVHPPRRHSAFLRGQTAANVA